MKRLIALTLLALSASAMATSKPPVPSAYDLPPLPSAVPRSPVQKVVSYTVTLTRVESASSALAGGHPGVALPDSMTYAMTALSGEDAHVGVQKRFALPCGPTPTEMAPVEFCNVSGGMSLTVRPLAITDGGRIKGTYVDVSLRAPERTALKAPPVAPVMQVLETRQVLPFVLGKPQTLVLGDYRVEVTPVTAK